MRVCEMIYMQREKSTTLRSFHFARERQKKCYKLMPKKELFLVINLSCERVKFLQQTKSAFNRPISLSSRERDFFQENY